ncbi:MAG: hypothetical protein JWN88_1905 [Frankiales bacterium]|nr:hypothetical protein [Frankiales bacterium]
MVDPTLPPVTGLLARVASLAFRRRWSVITGWVALLVATSVLSGALAGEFKADYSARGSDSKAASDLLSDRFPAQAGDVIDVVFRTEGPAADPQARAQVADLLARIADVEHVVGTSDPYADPAGQAPDGRTLLARAQLDVANPNDMPLERTEEIVALVEAAERPGFEVALDGETISLVQQGEIGSEVIGFVAAGVILLLMFGSVVAAGLPLLVAVTGLGVSSSLVGLTAAVIDVPDWSTSLAAMMGIGVGIDYVLLLVTRFREHTAAGLAPLPATIATVDTAGRSVLVAGTTVIISLVGLFATGLTAMRGAAVVTIFAVLLVMLAAVTLLPALLSLLGSRIDRLRLPVPRRATGRGASNGWVRWSRLVQRRAGLATVAGTAVLLALAAPVLGVSFGFPDAGSDKQGTMTHTAYTRIAEGFGAGANGPLLLAAQLPPGGSTATVEAVADRLEGLPGVASVGDVQVNPAGDTAVLTVVPTTSPQSSETKDLVRRIRDVTPAVTDGTGTRVYVGGWTATGIDSTDDLTGTLPALIGGVVGLSMLLLLAVFRSVAIAIKAAVMNLLSIAAAYGVVALVLEGGWFGQLFGIDSPTPLPAFIPVLMFAVLFGLSMDYEVFLLSRIREIYLSGRDTSTAVAEGLAATAKVITAAAAIMVAVFGAFVPSDVVFLKVIGIGLATAILVDATVVRMLLVPAVMQLLGERNWWLPGWLDRLLPHLHVEGHPERHTALPVPRERIDRPSPVSV